MKKRNHVTYDCHYHIVWTPKYRKELLVGEIEKDLRKIIEERVEELECQIEALEIMPDHVHILVNIPPQIGVHKFVKSCKGKSSRELRSKYKELRTRVPTLWSHSYFCATTGGVTLNKIKKYVEEQKIV